MPTIRTLYTEGFHVEGVLERLDRQRGCYSIASLSAPFGFINPAHKLVISVSVELVEARPSTNPVRADILRQG